MLNTEGQQHTDDPSSIKLLIQKQAVKGKEKEIIFFSYKKQGVIDSNFPEMLKEDFMLGF